MWKSLKCIAFTHIFSSEMTHYKLVPRFGMLRWEQVPARIANGGEDWGCKIDHGQACQELAMQGLNGLGRVKSGCVWLITFMNIDILS